MPKPTKSNWIDVPLAKLRKAPWNYKEDSPIIAEALKANMRRNGVIQNIIIRELGRGLFEIVNGNHRFDVAMSLKIDTIKAFNLGRVSKANAQRIAVITNETNFAAEDKALAGVIDNLLKKFPDGDLNGIPMTRPQLEDLAKLGSFTWDGYKPKTAGKRVKQIRIPVTKEIEDRWRAIQKANKDRTDEQIVKELAARMLDLKEAATDAEH